MPRLIVPSSGGGTKLIRTLRVGEDVGDGEATGVSVGDGDCGAVREGIADSWAANEEIDATANKIARLIFFVMSSGVETSLTLKGEKKL